MKIKTRIKLNLAFGFLCILFGIMLIAISLTKGSGYAGIEMFLINGVGLFLIGILRAIRYIPALRNKKKLEKIETQMADERVLLLSCKAGSAAFIVSTMGAYVYSLYLLLNGSPLFEQVSQFCSILLCIYLVCYFVIRKIN